eukprot:gene37084-50029_t
MESTVRTERVLRLHAEIREQRDAIASLRAEWAKLDAPMRLQGLAERHTKLKPITAQQYDSLKNLPDRPPSFAKPGDPDPIAAMIETIDPDIVTGCAMNDLIPGTGKPADKPVEPWRQRLIRSLLYGRNVDRAAKARARVGLAMIAFAGVY